MLLRASVSIEAYWNSDDDPYLKRLSDADVLWHSCERHGFGFVDATTPFLGANGLAHSKYVDPDKHGAEHHLDARRTYDVAATLICSALTC
jgi:hypothetical protein